MQPHLADVAAEAGVEDDEAHEHNHERSILLRVPAPEAAPTVIGPNAAQHRADERKEQACRDEAVGHTRQKASFLGFRADLAHQSLNEINHRNQGSHHARSIAEVDHRHVRREPEVRDEHGLELLKRVRGLAGLELNGQEHAGRAADGGHEQPEAAFRHPFGDQSKQSHRGTDEEDGLIQCSDRRALHDDAADDHASHCVTGGRS